MPQLPITRDVAALVGDFGEGVQNRSLLLDRFVFHKRWGLGELPAPEAHRWSLMRVSDGGSSDLHRDANKRREQIRPGVHQAKQERLRAEAQLAERLASTQVESADARALRQKHSRRFLWLFRSAFTDRASITIGKLEGRLAINLADGLLQNAGICLDRLFGLPYIPGSAIKGVCRHVALEELRKAAGDDQARLFQVFRHVFGTAENDFSAHGDLQPFVSLLDGANRDQRGAIAFLPAYPVDEAKVVVDLTNVHYPDYYQTGQTQQLANERPRPNPFPAVEIGAQFAFCLVLNGIANDPVLLSKATVWLETALTVRGLGAKTAAGYGWFSIDRQTLETILEQECRAAEDAAAQARKEAEARGKAEAEAKRLAALPPEERARDRFKALAAEKFAETASALASLADDDQKGFLLALLSPEKRDTWKAWKKSDKPNNKARVETLRKAAQQFGVNLR
jgi:CRISPR type III-B/RAMP module RAMP protein Cmr6